MKSATIRSFLLALLACVLMISMLVSCGDEGDGDETTVDPSVTTGPSDPNNNPGDEDCEHTYAAVVKEPTCVEGGYTVHTCTKCGGSYQDSETQPLGMAGHDWVMESIVPPGSTATGLAIYVCWDCCDCSEDELYEGTADHEGHSLTYKIEVDGYNAVLSSKVETTTTGMIVELIEKNQYRVIGYRHKSTPTETLIISPEVSVGLSKGTVVEIAANAFQGDQYLKEVHIPGTVKVIGEQAFFDCPQLNTIVIGPLTELTEIGVSAFGNCASLTEFQLPDTVESVGIQAFRGADGVVISNTEGSSLVSIGDQAFAGTATKEFFLPASLDASKMGMDIFYQCEDLHTVTFAEDSKLTALPVGLFRGCTALTSVEIPASVQEIMTNVFSGCKKLRTVTFAEGSALTSIGMTAFAENKALSTLVLPETLETIKTRAFYLAGLTKIAIPAAVTTIGDEAFYMNESLATVTFGEGSALTSLGEGVFRFDSSLTAISLPAGITKIAPFLFSGCQSLSSVELAADITEIGASAFYKTAALKNFTFDATVTAIGNDAFQRSGITAVSFPADSVLTTIGINAFYECNALTTVSLPASLTTVSDGAFYGCDTLASFTFATGATADLEIGKRVFVDCNALTTLAIPANLKRVSYYAFQESKVEAAAKAAIANMPGVEVYGAPEAE